MQAFAFVDYDNAKAITREKSHWDVLANIETMIERLAGVRKIYFNEVDELVIRLYGGWIDEVGRNSTRADWVLPHLSDLRGRRYGTRLRIELAVSTLHISHIRLIGTYRIGAGVEGQKMVDTLIAVDISHMAEISDCPLIVLSDDEDIVPPILNAAARGSKTYLIRKRLEGEGLNDASLSETGVHFLKF
jgi:hypothetical protein